MTERRLNQSLLVFQPVLATVVVILGSLPAFMALWTPRVHRSSHLLCCLQTLGFIFRVSKSDLPCDTPALT